MYCPNCGKEIKEDNKFCYECGTKLDNSKEEKVSKVSKEVKEEKQYIKGMKNDALLCTISLVCMYGMGLVNFILYSVSNAAPALEGFLSLVRGITGLGPIAAWVLVIYARVHYKQSKFAKVLLIIYIIQTVLVIVAIIILIATCANLLHDCSNIGALFNLLW